MTRWSFRGVVVQQDPKRLSRVHGSVAADPQDLQWHTNLRLDHPEVTRIETFRAWTKGPAQGGHSIVS